ncbi:MAG: hypothetical protein KDE51_15130 [Anaerolineales bacterium]|nr:hypothetical protein [Anaerolineales bacterium]
MLFTPNRTQLNYETAVQDFRRLYRQALWQQFNAWVSGKASNLLSYDDVRTKVDVSRIGKPVLREVPLNGIQGSVDRYLEYTPDFLPKRLCAEERWARIKTAVLDMRGVPPIELFELDGVYFVQDGHHRVSVARQLGVPTITAYVTTLETRPTDQMTAA